MLKMKGRLFKPFAMCDYICVPIPGDIQDHMCEWSAHHNIRHSLF